MRRSRFDLPDHDHYTVHSTDGRVYHARVVIADGVEDARQTHEQHYPHLMVLAIREHGK